MNNIKISFDFYLIIISARPSSPINTSTQIEMDVTSRQNSLTFEATANYQSTKGISVQHVRLYYLFYFRIISINMMMRVKKYLGNSTNI